MEIKSPDHSRVAMAITTMMSHQSDCHRESTSITVGVKQRRGVREPGPVGVVVDGPHPGLVPAAVLPRDINGVADTAVRQPPGVALVQAGLPGQVELSHSGQLGSQGMAVSGGCGQTQLL